jgi:hypothetical protein
MNTNKELQALLAEADTLLAIAWGAMVKDRLEGQGNNCRLPHEVRMFALDFSREKRNGPGALQVEGTGRYDRWRRDVRVAILPTSFPRPR